MNCLITWVLFEIMTRLCPDTQLLDSSKVAIAK